MRDEDDRRTIDEVVAAPFDQYSRFIASVRNFNSFKANSSRIDHRPALSIARTSQRRVAPTRCTPTVNLKGRCCRLTTHRGGPGR